MKNFCRIVLFLLFIDVFCIASEPSRLRLIGPKIPVAVGQSRNIWPAGAYNPVSKQFLVTWTEERNFKQRIRGRLINLDGTVGTIRDFSPTSNTAFNLVLKYSPVNNSFLLFSSRAMGLHSQLINDSGGTIRLSSIAPEGLIDTVSFQPKTSRFFVAGFAESALLVDTQGKLIRRIEFRNSSVASFFRQIVLADPHSTDFLLIGQQPETLKMFLLRFSSNGTQRGPAKRLNVTGFLQGAAFNPGKGEILLLLGDFDTLHTSQLNPQFDVVSTRVLGNYRSGDLGSSNLVFAQGKYIVAYSRDEKLWMRMLGPNGNPIGNELGLGPIMDFSFRKSILYSPLENVGLLIWETAPVSDIRHVFARRFRID